MLDVSQVLSRLSDGEPLAVLRGCRFLLYFDDFRDHFADNAWIGFAVRAGHRCSIWNTCSHHGLRADARHGRDLTSRRIRHGG